MSGKSIYKNRNKRCDRLATHVFLFSAKNRIYIYTHQSEITYISSRKEAVVVVEGKQWKCGGSGGGKTIKIWRWWWCWCRENNRNVVVVGVVVVVGKQKCVGGGI